MKLIACYVYLPFLHAFLGTLESHCFHHDRDRQSKRIAINEQLALRRQFTINVLLWKWCLAVRRKNSGEDIVDMCTSVYGSRVRNNPGIGTVKVAVMIYQHRPLNNLKLNRTLKFSKF